MTTWYRVKSLHTSGGIRVEKVRVAKETADAVWLGQGDGWEIERPKSGAYETYFRTEHEAWRFALKLAQARERDLRSRLNKATCQVGDIVGRLREIESPAQEGNLTTGA